MLLISEVSFAGNAEIDDKKNPSEEDKDKKVEVVDENKDMLYLAPKKSGKDSSLYSISKYNFLFYMVYKVKYLDSETPPSSQYAEE